MDRYILKSESGKKDVLSRILDLPTSDPWEVLVRPYKFNRSVEQNRLYWKWMTLCAGEWGGTKEEWHDVFKQKYAIQIWIRDDAGYAEMAEAVKHLEGTREYFPLKRKIIEMTSTKDFNTKQMSEYMEAVEKCCLEHSIVLPVPDEKIIHRKKDTPKANPSEKEIQEEGETGP